MTVEIRSHTPLSEGDHVIFFKDQLYALVNPKKKIRLFAEDQEMSIDETFHPLLVHVSHFYNA